MIIFVSRGMSSIEPSGLPLVETSLPALAILGIIAQLPTRYSPDGLAVSLGAEQRIGVAGWTLERVLGAEADMEETTVKQLILDLCGRGLVEVSETRRLVATEAGHAMWHAHERTAT